MACNSSVGDILAPGDAAQLIELGLVNLPNPPTGSIQVHKRRLNRSSDEENNHIPLNVTIGSRPDAFVTIPEKLISKATIEYVGFNSDKATEIWSGWVNWPSGPIIREIDLGDSTTLEVSFIDWVKRHTGNPHTDDVWEEDDSAWFRCMEQHGIATELQRSIMDPRFKDMRLNDTCIGWLRDTMEMRYAGLIAIQRASAERERALGNQGLQPGPKDNSEMQHTNTERSGLASREIDTLARPSNNPGYTVLCKAVDQARINGLFDHQGALRGIGALLSASSATDFSRMQDMFCLTPDYDLARKHAAWIKQRGSPAVIVQIAVQNSAIEAMGPQRVFWPSSEWRELVWHCRTRTILPKELAEKYRDAFLIIGTTANRPNNYYRQFSTPRELTEACVFKLQGPADDERTVVQYVFSSDYEGETFPEDQARDTMKIFHFGTPGLESWVEENSRFS